MKTSRAIKPTPLPSTDLIPFAGKLDGLPGNYRLDGSHDARVRFGRDYRVPFNPLPSRDKCRDIFHRRIFPHIALVGGCWLLRNLRGVKHHPQINVDGHAIVASRITFVAFHGPLGPDELACHTCDERACNNPAHLFGGTWEDNSLDMARKGHSARAKITAETVLEIRAAAGSLREIADRFHMSKAQVGYIRQRRSWRHLP